MPDHSWLSKARTRLPHAGHAAVFDRVLALIAEAGLVKGDRIGVDASTMEANAARRNIVRRDTGEGDREMLEHLARESGIETPTAEDLARLDRKRKGKKLSNQDRVSRSDPEARVARMKDAATHLANQAESYFSRLRRMVRGQHHHVSHKYLHQYANEAAWREDHRRIDNGGQFNRTLGAAPHSPVSRNWKGYGQRAA